MEHLTPVLQVFASVAQQMHVVFPERRVPLVPVSVALLQHVLDKPLDHIVMLQTMFVSVLPHWLLAVELQTPVIVGRANVGRLQPVAIQGRHVNLEHANAARHQHV